MRCSSSKLVFVVLYMGTLNNDRPRKFADTTHFKYFVLSDISTFCVDYICFESIGNIDPFKFNCCLFCFFSSLTPNIEGFECPSDEILYLSFNTITSIPHYMPSISLFIFFIILLLIDTFHLLSLSDIT